MPKLILIFFLATVFCHGQKNTRARLLQWERQNKYIGTWYSRGNYQRALDTAKRNWQVPFSHAYHQTSLHNLGALYFFQGAYEKAKPFYQKKVRLYQRKFGAKHLQTMLAMADLATLYAKQKNYIQAQILLEKVMRLKNQKQVEFYNIAIELIYVYQKLKKYVLAINLAQKQFNKCKIAYGKDDSQTLYFLTKLAKLYHLSKEHDKALATLKYIHNTYREKLGAKHPATLEITKNLAFFYREQKQYKKAEELYLQLLPGANIPEMYRLRAFATLKELAVMYQKQGKKTQAKEFFESFYRMNKAEYGIKHFKTIEALHQFTLFNQKVEKYHLASAQYAKLTGTIKSLQVILMGLSNQDLNLFFDLQKQVQNGLLALCQSHATTKNAKLALSLSLISKNLKRRIKQQKKALQRNQRKKLQNLCKKYIEEILKKTVRTRVSQKKLFKIKQDIQRESSRLSLKDDRFRLATIQVELEDVLSNIKKDEVLLYFYIFKHIKTNTNQVLAIATGQKIKIVSLGKLSAIEKLVLQYLHISKKATLKNRQELFKNIYKTLWQPLEVHLKEIKRVYILADGIISQFFWKNEQDLQEKFLIKKYSLIPIQSPRDLVTRANKEKKREIGQKKSQNVWIILLALAAIVMFSYRLKTMQM